MLKYISGFLTAIVVIVLIAVALDLSVQVKEGYAGDGHVMQDGEVYRTLYYRPEDYTKSITMVNGTHIEDNSRSWTSFGYSPVIGDYVVVIEFRLYWDFIVFELIYGWGFSMNVEELRSPFNFIHPELETGEIYLANTDDGIFRLLSWETKRKGEVSYSICGEKLYDATFPVFVQRSELYEAGFDLDGFFEHEKAAAEEICN